jgi:hypothetical protein
MSVTISLTDTNITVGGTGSGSITDVGIADGTVYTITSSDDTVATVDNASITLSSEGATFDINGVSEGSGITFTATQEDDTTNTATTTESLDVTANTATVTVDLSADELAIGEDVLGTITDTVNPVGTLFEITVSTPGIVDLPQPSVTLDDTGKAEFTITGTGEGTTTVTVTQSDDSSNTYTTEAVTVEAGVANYTVNVFNTPQDYWASDWELLSTPITIEVIDPETGLPAAGVDIELSDDSNANIVWGGNGNIGVTSAVGQFHTLLSLAGPPEAGTRSYTITINVNSSPSADFALLVVNPTLAAPTFPLAVSNFLSQEAVDAGVYTRIFYPNQREGDAINLFWGGSIIHYNVGSSSESISIPIPESYLIQGYYATGFSVTDVNNNNSFSSVYQVVVQNSHNTGVLDQPAPTVPLAGDGIINQSDLYKGVTIEVMPDESWLYLVPRGVSLFWVGYNEDGITSPAAQQYQAFSAEEVMAAMTNDTPLVMSVDEATLVALGTGTADAYYTVLDKTAVIHSSKMYNSRVDVEPPGKKKK